METGIRIFEKNEFGSIRTFMQGDGTAWFCGQDVCSILGYGNSRDAIRRHVHPNDVLKQIAPTMNSRQWMSFINESGLYALILRSKLSEAKEFQRWVTSEVLPNLRKYGAYMTEEVRKQVLYSPEFLRQIAQQMEEETSKRKALEATLEQQKPKMELVKAIEGSNCSVLIRDMAKILFQRGVNIGEKRLYEYLREQGFLCQFGESRNRPTQRSYEMGLMEVKCNTIRLNDGSLKTIYTTKITVKGQIYFVNRLITEQMTCMLNVKNNANK